MPAQVVMFVPGRVCQHCKAAALQLSSAPQEMLTTQQQHELQQCGCEIRFDNLTRQLYATDASIYQIVPKAVGFPRNAPEASAVIKAAAHAGVSVIPRGAGTGLVGGAIGDGLVIDFARYNTQIAALDLARGTVRVGAGVVLDQLNAFLKPHGFCFGPDVATSSRATIGGMIANNSSGSHCPVYGTTADHVLSVDVVTAEGRIDTMGLNAGTFRPQRELVQSIVELHRQEIQERMPAGLLKRWPGYGIDRWLRQPGNLGDIMAGSEGTLAAIISADLRIVPLPKRKGLGIFFFASVADAMSATTELLPLRPAAIEHIDRVLLDQTRNQLEFKAARDLLELDARPCEALLLVEFFGGNVDDQLEQLRRCQLGLRSKVVSSAEANLVWALRKAGLSLLTGCKGPAKPVTCVEDTAVDPRYLPQYVAGLDSILRPLGLNASYYGHAASGLLHVRPVLDLHRSDDFRKLRHIADQVSALVRQFRGSLAGEHGIGIARTEYMAAHLGPQLMNVMAQIKQSFDPHHLLNPGKIIDDGRYKIDTNLRIDSARPIKLPFEPMLRFAAKDESFIANLEQCNGCGGCRKATPSMCPTFVAIGEEVMSTRGRANVIRAALDSRLDGNNWLASADLEAALATCLSCKACTTECPSNVNMTLLKAELLQARWSKQGKPASVRLFSSVDFLGKMGCAMPWLVNPMLKSSAIRALFCKLFGISVDRPLPPYASERFDAWFHGRKEMTSGKRGRVILWDDTFVRYNEPHIGKAAVAVLEAAGFEVQLLRDRQCCGRPAFSQGNLEKARKLGAHNVELLTHLRPEVPVIFLEPSCYSMFAQDYKELAIANADAIAERCFVFEEFIENLLRRDGMALQFKDRRANVAIHAHCHTKAIAPPAYMRQLGERLPGRSVTLLDTGCCGMAGAFGAMQSKQELSKKIAEPLVEKINRQPAGTTIVASGTSCRHQISHLTDAKPKHMAELLAEALEGLNS